VPVDIDELSEEIVADTNAALDRALRKLRRGIPALALLVALEREQVAAVAYSDDMIADRIAALPVADGGRELIRRVVLWVHRDEALHAQYIRGLLLRSRQASPWGFVLARQLVGSVGGWASAVSHRSHSDAFGLRSSAALSMLAAGRIVGHVPAVLLRALREPGFRSLCALNVALERSAIVSYERLLPLVAAEQREVFERILDDERRHADAFQVLYEALHDDDTLRVSVDELARRLAEVSRWFLPAQRRTLGDRHRLGRGGVVHVELGTTDASAAAVVERALQAIGLEQLVAPGATVAIRAPFMLGYDRRDRSNVIDGEVLEAVAGLMRTWGASDVAVVEAPTAYDRFFGNRSVHSVANYLGLQSETYRIVDVETDLRPITFDRGLAVGSICATWADADVRIVLAKLRGDPAEVAQLCMATLPGIAGRVDEQVHTDRMVDYRTATLMALDVAPPDAAIVEAWGPVADGPVGVMGCHRPSPQRRVYTGHDAIAVDSVVLADLGFHDPHASAFLRQADQWCGAITRATVVSGTRAPINGFRTPHASAWYRLVSATAAPMYFHLSRRGSLFVPRLDEQAFPAIDGAGLITRTVRRVAQNVFGLHPPA
jgi:uncharacterized protein (DUF362 family)